MSAPAAEVPVELLERGDSLATLKTLFETVRSDAAGTVAWIGGEAGVGKSALLERFCQEQDGPTRIAWGLCEPLRTPRPLGPFLDIAQVIGGYFAERVSEAAKPYEVGAALLSELRGRRPTVLMFEDLHWADEASLDVLSHLVTRIAAVPALVLATYRDDELDRAPALRVVLGELAPRRSRLRLGALSEAAVATLSEPVGADAAQIHTLTGGNPFYVTEVLAAGGEHLPETVRDAVLARVARLSEPARRLLEAAAIVPGQAEVWLMQELGGDLLDRLDECLASGVLTAGTDHIGFRHELGRLAMEDAIPPDRRLSLHRRVLAVLSSREPPDLARLAHHAEAAAAADQVLKWAPLAAAQAAASGAHREAAAQYARALRFGTQIEPQQRAELLERHAEECYLTSRLDEAIAAQQEALECRRQLGDRLGEGDALRTLSRLMFFAGRASEGEPLVLNAIELLEQMAPGRELALAYANASQRRMSAGDTAEAIAWGNRALELARSLGDTETEVYALSNVAAAEFRIDADAGHLKLKAALALARRYGHEHYIALTFSRLVMFPVRYRRFDIARQHLSAGVEFCSELGLDTFRLYLMAFGARLDLDQGRWDEATASASLVLRDARSAQVACSFALVVLGLARSRRGDSDATEPLEEAAGIVSTTAEIDGIAQVAAARAEAAWLRGDRDGVATATEAALALAQDRQEPWALGELSYWRWRAAIDEELSVEIAEPYRLSIAGDWAAASRAWRTLGCPYDAALALADADEDAALRRSFDELQALGARPAAAIVARRLRDRGVRGLPRGPRARTRQNPAGLTGRELEVLKLMANGLRNADIAERLVVSEKTIHHHVSAVLRKLDVHTRGEATAAAARLGIGPDGPP